jgi:twitching motility protein PilT
MSQVPAIADLLKHAWDQKASDLFIKADAPPTMRVHGKITPTEFPVLAPEDTRKLCHSIMTEKQIAQFEKKHELDLAFTVEDITRVRANVYLQRQSFAATLRLIPLQIYTLDELLMPQALRDLTRYRQGLVLVTGPTGCGKSTTLAAMLDVINRTRRAHIITVEDPIEFVHNDIKGLVSQREVGIDTDSFHDALRAIVRESPDVILIGEMRDIETMHACLQAAETGHLVFSTVHTASAAETMERIINMFPPHEKPQVCLRMSISLLGIVSQKLLPRTDVPGRIAAVEVMIATPTISKLIEEGRSSQLYEAIREGDFWGMQTLNQCLLKYHKAGIISEEEALASAGNVTELRQMLRKG